ncbi:MAG: DUF134 domain-containing protein [Lachnospiraceae bacterium]|nr:DUF134 domain-containing protein [Lachnospiraceae bacterium]
MARPSKTRFICKMPAHCRFTTEGNPKNGINLTIEEYETIRLMDYLGMTQAECSKQMNVSRATVQALYTEARKKMSRFLVEGTYMEIGGGNFQLCSSPCSATSCFQKQTQNKKKGKGDKTMKIAVTYENGEVFQHFGHTEQFKVYEVEDGKIISSEIVDTNGQGHGALAGFLFNSGIDVLICGGIGGGARNALAEAGIQLYPGAMGNADAQVESFLKGTLSYDPDTMCSHHSHAEGHVCGDHGCGSHSCH